MQKNNVLQLIMIHELVALFGESIIWKVSKAGRKRFARNGSRMSDSNLATFVFARNPDGTVVQVADDLVSVGCSWILMDGSWMEVELDMFVFVFRIQEFSVVGEFILGHPEGTEKQQRIEM